MSSIIFKQPNGLYGRWSSIVDGITWYNFNKEDVKKYMASRYKYIVDNKDFFNYDCHTLEGLLSEEGTMMTMRALLEGNFEEDIITPIKAMGASKELITLAYSIKDQAEKELRE